MRASSFVMGIIGGIITFIIGYITVTLDIVGDALFGSSELEYLSVMSFLGGIMGIVGGALGKKVGGVIMIVGGILALTGAGLFGVLGMILLVVGGILALREKPVTAQPSISKSNPDTSSSQ